ncbi:MAG TPA: Rieske (2Fe-2S) protein [Solirubrobacteraceae bacterium]|nr:Rieske (2Fe-2S) protein [Solirubrobacteraceae bacterium]
MATETTTTTPGATGTTWTAPPPSEPKLHAVLERLESARVLDGPAEKVAKTVRGSLPAGGVKDLLSGEPLGHPLHPLLTDVVIGTWTSATILDLIGGSKARPAAERLIGVGILAALPTAASGATDWADTTVKSPPVRRVGAVHAALNVGALALYGASLTARRRGRHARGALLGLAGAGLLGASGQLGGHLAFIRGVGVAETAFDDPIADWTPACFDAEVREGEPFVATVAGQDVLLVRQDGAVRALADRCNHRGGPLHRGTLQDGCVTCPWHASRFRLEDGSVDRGPASSPQPTYDVRVAGDRIEIRSAASRPA